LLLPHSNTLGLLLARNTCYHTATIIFCHASVTHSFCYFTVTCCLRVTHTSYHADTTAVTST